MKPIKCEVHEPCIDGIKITCHASIRKAIKYCKANGIPYTYIQPKECRHIWLFEQPSKGCSYSEKNAHMAFKGE